jgi:hypothetical protein
LRAERLAVLDPVADVDARAVVFGSGAVGVLADLVTLLVIAVTMISIEWRLGLLLLVSQVPVVLGILWLQGRFRKANYRVREELSQLNADLQENLQGLEVVQMFRREATNSARFSQVTAAYREAVNGTILFDSAISAFIEWVALSAGVCCIVCWTCLTKGLMFTPFVCIWDCWSSSAWPSSRESGRRPAPPWWPCSCCCSAPRPPPVAGWPTAPPPRRGRAWGMWQRRYCPLPAPLSAVG